MRRPQKPCPQVSHDSLFGRFRPSEPNPCVFHHYQASSETAQTIGGVAVHKGWLFEPCGIERWSMRNVDARPCDDDA